MGEKFKSYRYAQFELRAPQKMRPINCVIVHCTATPAGREVTAAEVDKWHRAQGWAGIGYHYLIRLDGTVEEGRPLDTPGAHCRGHNAASVGVCYAGGLAADGKTPADTRTPAQRAALRTVLAALKKRWPAARICGHRDFNKSKACPCFDATREYAEL